MGSATRIVVVRHGETAWNAAGRIQGQLDIPLNDRGRWQARRAGQALLAEGLEVIYSSDLARAAGTAEAIGAACGEPVRFDAGLRERGFGVFEGLTFEQIEARWPSQTQRWRQRDPAFGPQGGETLQGFYDRVVEAATALAQRHPGQTIALVAHGGVLDCLYRAASRQHLQAPRTWQLGNASINRLLHADAGYTLVGWNDTGHLDEAGADEFADGGADRSGAIGSPAA